jgi:flagellin-like protein
MIRRDNGVSPIIAVILMLAITVVLASAAWLMISGMMSDIEVPPTYVNLARETSQDNSTRRIVHVAGVDRVFNLANFEAVLVINVSVDQDSKFDPLLHGSAGNITFVDVNGDDKLNQGDYFIVTITPPERYELKVFWKDTGAQVATLTWDEA